MIWKVCRFKLIMACLLVGFGVWPGILPAKTVETAAAVVSLDYCADQYVLKLLSADRIKALSPDAVREFSYMRQAALDHPSVKPTAEEVIARKPDLIVRTYGGGPNASHFFKRLGIPVLQIGYSNSVDSVKEVMLDVSSKLGVAEVGVQIVADMNSRMAALPRIRQQTLLYVTPGGITGGQGTLIDSMIEIAGLQNFQERGGWQSLPLEDLAYNKPELFATAFYNDKTNHRNFWSAARHPVIREQLAVTRYVNLQGATTACGGWFIVDAIEKLASEAGSSQ